MSDLTYRWQIWEDEWLKTWNLKCLLRILWQLKTVSCRCCTAPKGRICVNKRFALTPKWKTQEWSHRSPNTQTNIRLELHLTSSYSKWSHEKLNLQKFCFNHKQDSLNPTCKNKIKRVYIDEKLQINLWMWDISPLNSPTLCELPVLPLSFTTWMLPPGSKCWFLITRTIAKVSLGKTHTRPRQPQTKHTLAQLVHMQKSNMSWVRGKHDFTLQSACTLCFQLCKCLLHQQPNVCEDEHAAHAECIRTVAHAHILTCTHTP